MIEVIITGLVGLVTTISSSVVTWLLARKKYNTEVDSNVIKNMSDSLEFYKKLADDQKNRLDELTHRNRELENEVRELRKQVFTLMNSVCYNLECTLRQRGVIPQEPSYSEDSANINKEDYGKD